MATESDEPYLHVSPEAMLRADRTYKPTSKAGNDAYRAGWCKTCHVVKHRPGGTECYNCFIERMNNFGVPLLESETVYGS
jgi:hypothetical protein